MTGPAHQQLDLAARVLDEVRTEVGPAARAEVIVDRMALALTRFANSIIHQNVAEATTTVRLRLHLDGRTATGSTTLLDREGLFDLVVRTAAASRWCPVDPGWPGLAPPEPLLGGGVVDEAVVAATPAQRAERVRAFVEAAGGLSTAGYCRTVHWISAFANSAGQHVSGATTEAAMDGIARTPTSDGVARLAGSRLVDVDGGVLGARAAAKARAGVDPVDAPPGRYEVVLEPTAVADILEHLAVHGFNGRAANERRTFASAGTAQFDRAITLVDDPLSGVGLPFDTEGTPKRRLVLVESGTTLAVAHDRRTARQAGGRSTGHAVPGTAAWGPFPANLSIEAAGHPAGDADGGARSGSGGGPDRDPGVPGQGADTPAAGPAADAGVAALVAGVRRGLLVTDHWYTRVLDPRPLVVTGLTRNGVWLIENGEITVPVRNLRFTQSYPQALAPGAVLGVGGRAVTLPSSWQMLSYRAPALRLAAWNFTGGANG